MLEHAREKDPLDLRLARDSQYNRNGTTRSSRAEGAIDRMDCSKVRVKSKPPAAPCVDRGAKMTVSSMWAEIPFLGSVQRHGLISDEMKTTEDCVKERRVEFTREPERSDKRYRERGK